MKKLALALLVSGGMALPMSVLAADVNPPAEQGKPPAASPPTQPGAEGRAASSMFDQLDANKDGAIDSTELSKSATAKANAKSMDLDGDGKISRSEWEAFEAGSTKGPR